eukprot:Nk52_evm27s239 gene=Nk52_evmTU27s239
MSKLGYSILLLVSVIVVTVSLTSASEIKTYSQWEPDLFVSDFAVELKKHNLIEDAYLEPFDLAKKYGFALSNYTFTTSDNYILMVNRMKAENPLPYCKGDNKPVLLAHGLLDSFTTWMQDLPHQSLSYLLAMNCYDVWMTNNRGNTYSTGHATLDTESREYWDFSWDEHSRFDMPETIDFVLKQTGHASLSAYIGHSQGTTQFWAVNYWRPDIVKKVDKFYALAPVMVTNHVDIPLIKMLTNLVGTGGSKWLISIFHKYMNPFFGRDSVDNKVTNFLCDSILKSLCKNPASVALDIMAGNYFNGTRVLSYLTRFPSGTSSNNMIHFAQMTSYELKRGVFGQYDYGDYDKNMAAWGQDPPALYNVTNLRVPAKVFWGSEDKLADPRDVKLLMEGLKPCQEAGACEVEYEEVDNFGHCDFVWGTEANSRVYSKIIDELNSGTIPPAHNRTNIAPIRGTVHGPGWYIFD